MSRTYGIGVWARRCSCSARLRVDPRPKILVPAWERENPIKPGTAPLGMEVFFEDVKPPSPASVRLGPLALLRHASLR